MRNTIVCLAIFIYVSGIGLAQTPEVVSTSPLQNGLNIPPGSNISVTFNVDMDETTINDSTFLVLSGYSGPQNGVISYNGSTRTGNFNPSVDFDAGDHITVILTTGVKSLSGIPLGSGYSWSFTIESGSNGDYFQYKDIYNVGRALGISTADLDGDYDLDLVAASKSTHCAYVLLNNGYGGFDTPVGYPTSGWWARSVCIADFDHDLDMDIAVANDFSNDVSILMNNGNGTFDTAALYQLGISGPNGISASDIDGDGDIDLAVSSDSSEFVVIFKNTVDGLFVGPFYTYAGNIATALAFADFDGDGDNDFTVASYVDSISLFRNDGDGSFLDHTSFYIGNSKVISMIAPDVDGDGDADLVLANYDEYIFSVLFNDGTGAFSSPVDYHLEGTPNFIVSPDYDGDGDLDLVITTFEYGSSVSCFLNDGNGSFSEEQTLAAAFPYAVTAGDFNGDNELDFAFANYQSTSVTIYKRVFPGVVTGVVSDTGNIRLEGVRVLLWNPAVYDTTDVDGGYLFMADSGSYNINFQKPGYYATNISDVAVDYYDTTVVNATLELIPTGFVAGNITDENADPLDDVYVFAMGTNYGDSSDTNGNYCLEVITGTHDITFRKSGYYDSTIYDIGITLNDTIGYDMTLTQLLPGIRGRVINIEAIPVENVLVSIPDIPLSTYTNINGYFFMEDIIPGLYDISFSHQYYYDTTLTGVAAEPGLYDTLEVESRSKSAAMGHVANLADSLPLPDVYIYAHNTILNDYTDYAGNYFMEIIPDRVYHLRFIKPNFSEGIYNYVMAAVGETLNLDSIYLEPRSLDLNVWYGNLDGSPITAPINETILVDVFVQAPDSLYMTYLHLPLGTDDQYIVDHLSETEGVFYYPLTNWDYVEFQHEENLFPGWHSQSLLGFADIEGLSNPYLHCPEPTRIASFALKIVDNPALIGDTVICFTEGRNLAEGGPQFGDTTGVILYYPLQSFSKILFVESQAGNCEYVTGDANNSGDYNGLDITYGVGYFKSGPPPPYECECTAGNTWYVAGDVNGSCNYNGLDITYGVAYFKGGPSPTPCPDCPPAGQ